MPSITDLRVSPEAPLSEEGLYVGREIPEGAFDEFVAAATGFHGITGLRQFFNVNEIARDEVRNQASLADVTRQAAEQQIRKHVRTTNFPLTVKTEGMAVMRRKSGDSILVLIFDQPSQQMIRAERRKAQRALESLAPGGNYRWAQHSSFGIPLGFADPELSEPQRRDIKKLRRHIATNFRLQPAHFLPHTKLD